MFGCCVKLVGVWFGFIVDSILPWNLTGADLGFGLDDSIVIFIQFDTMENRRVEERRGE